MPEKKANNVWPLTESQRLSINAVSQQIATLRQETQSRVSLAFRELAEIKNQDPAKLKGTLIDDNGKLAFKVEQLGSE